MFCLSQSQNEQYKEYLQTETIKVADRRSPAKIYKWKCSALVNNAIDFTIGETITAEVVDGPQLGTCPEHSDENGLTIKMSEKQLGKYTPKMGDVIRWTPQGCLYSADPILSVNPSKAKTVDLNEDLDIVFG